MAGEFQKFVTAVLIVTALYWTVVSSMRVVNPPGRSKVTLPPFTRNDVLNAMTASKTEMGTKHELEASLGRRGVTLPTTNPAYFNKAFRKQRGSTRAKAERAELQLQAAVEFSKRTGMDKLQAVHGLMDANVSSAGFGNCSEEIQCDSLSKFRTIDGSCNNLNNPDWGQSETAFVRLLFPDYSDGLTSPRVSTSGAPLPSARVVSRTATTGFDSPDARYTHMLMQWGQFLDHDLTHTPVSSGGWFAITCCSEGNVRPAADRHFDCLPIEIPSDDPFFRSHNQRCMEFVRSAPAPRRDCNLGFREQLNELTAYVDASNVYGSLEHEASDLREFAGGRLKAYRNDGHNLLPQDTDVSQCSDQPRPCFLAGDVRVNEQPDLTVIHTIWMRHHNRLANELSSLNPHWDDERIYQEARRIVGAQMQHITYSEFLPILLGNSFMRKYDLLPQRRGFISTYDRSVDASISNAFATAAFRIGHTLVQSFFDGYTNEGIVDMKLLLNGVFFANSFLYNRGALDSMTRGLVNQPAQQFDASFSEELTNRLFARNGSFGMDLVALNTQRGRDHGLPSYTQFRELCGLGTVNSFQDLSRDIKTTNLRSLMSVYEDVHDIDLFIGGSLEKPKKGALTGRTFQCLIGEQFFRLKFGDRFFYENGDCTHTRFTLDQLDSIRNTRLSTVICDNGGDIDEIPVNAFVNQPRVSCSDTSTLPRLDLSLWRE